MKQTVSKTDFRDAFRTMDRAGQFSREGLDALFDHLEQYEQDTGDELELDVIALCCDYSEDTYAEVAESNGIDVADLDHSAVREAVLNYLSEHTEIVHAGDDTVLFQVF